MIESFLTVDGQFENTIVIERSKFICYIKGVQDEDDAKNFIAKIKKQNSLATHNCYAYIADELGLVQKFSDDGEPQGTAGLPMLEALKGRKLYKTCAVVTRYFGGVKLGAGGLVRAYSSSVLNCADIVKIANYITCAFYNVVCNYENYSQLNSLLNKLDVAVKSVDYGDNIAIQLAVKLNKEKDFIQTLLDVFKGSPTYTKISEGFFNFN